MTGNFAAKLVLNYFAMKTIFDFHMHNFGRIIENKADLFVIKSKITFKMLSRTENKNEQVIKLFNFCSNLVP